MHLRHLFYQAKSLKLARSAYSYIHFSVACVVSRLSSVTLEHPAYLNCSTDSDTI